MVVFVVSNGKFFSEMYLRCFNPSKISLRLLFSNKSYRHVVRIFMGNLGYVVVLEISKIKAGKEIKKAPIWSLFSRNEMFTTS